MVQEASKPDADPEAIYKVRFFVAAAPKDASTLIYSYDAKKAESKPATVSNTKVKAQSQNLVLNVPLLVKDQSTMLSNHLTKVSLVVQQPETKQSQGFFLERTPADILKDKEALAEVNDALKLLQRFNVWVEATVKASADGVIMVTQHTQLKEY